MATNGRIEVRRTIDSGRAKIMACFAARGGASGPPEMCGYYPIRETYVPDGSHYQARKAAMFILGLLLAGWVPIIAFVCVVCVT